MMMMMMILMTMTRTCSKYATFWLNVCICLGPMSS